MMKNCSAGFTLLELLLVITIMGTITAVMVPNLRSFNNNQRLYDAAVQLQTDIRVVQNNAASGVKCTVNTASNWYLLFNRDNATNTINNYSLGATCLNSEAYTPQQLQLPATIKVTQIDLDACPITNIAEINQAKVTYSNIYAQMNFSNGFNSCSNTNPQMITIYLKSDTLPGSVYKVILNKGGSIYVQ